MVRAPLLALCALAVWSPPLAAQTTPVPPIAVPPLALILPNFNAVPIGEVAALEGGAFVARANDTSAGYYNPAGLARAIQSAISGSSGAYQINSVTPEGLTNVKDVFKQIPAMFGVVVHDVLGRPEWAAGFAVARTSAWDQTVDAEALRTPGQERTTRLRISTDAAYDAWLVTMGVGYTFSDRLRAGATLDGQYTSVSRRQSIADQVLSTSGLQSFAYSTLGSVHTTHLRGTVGVQFDPSESWHFGAVMRTPGWEITSGGDASLESLGTANGSSVSASFFDPEADVQYRLPLELKAGGAWIGPRAQVEVDLLTYKGTGEYTAIQSGQPVTLIVDPAGGAPAVSSVPYVGARVDSRTVVNVAIGGRYQLKPDRTWTLHGGYATDRSPVGEDDTAFTRVDLQHVTVGISGRTTLFLGSVGFRYSRGRSDPIDLSPQPGSGTTQTRFTVSSLGLVYSLALLF